MSVEAEQLAKWEDDLPSPEELMPLSQSLITPNIAIAFNIPTTTTTNSSSAATRKPRLVWTPQLHKRFVDAIAHLGIKNAVPKTIMQLMNVEGLTRENVASHLQKYRLYLKRMENASSSSSAAAFIVDPATDRLFAAVPVPRQFLGPLVPVATVPCYRSFAAATAEPNQYYQQRPMMSEPRLAPCPQMLALKQPAVQNPYVDQFLGSGCDDARRALKLFPN